MVMPKILAAVVLFAAVAAGASPAAAARTVTVELRDIEFSKRTVQIRRGDSVRWVWRDRVVSHDVTSRGRPRFRSSDTKIAGTHRVRFTRAGTYRYICTIHPNMRARVVVR